MASVAETKQCFILQKGSYIEILIILSLFSPSCDSNDQKVPIVHSLRWHCCLNTHPEYTVLVGLRRNMNTFKLKEPI